MSPLSQLKNRVIATISDLAQPLGSCHHYRPIGLRDSERKVPHARPAAPVAPASNRFFLCPRGQAPHLGWQVSRLSKRSWPL